MVHYSVDTDTRLKVHIVLAAASIGLTYVLHLVAAWIPALVTGPSVLTIFGVLIVVFNKFIWRIPILSRPCGFSLLPIPNVDGEWAGKFTRMDGKQVPVTAKITQTWTTIDIVFESEETVSRVTSASLYVTNRKHLRIVYTYLVEDKRPGNGENQYGEGAVWLEIVGERKHLRLEGRAFSSKLRSGTLRLQRRNVRQAARRNRLPPRAGGSPRKNSRRKGSIEGMGAGQAAQNGRLNGER
jgi:hypothetical protein